MLQEPQDSLQRFVADEIDDGRIGRGPRFEPVENEDGGHLDQVTAHLAKLVSQLGLAPFTRRAFQGRFAGNEAMNYLDNRAKAMIVELSLGRELRQRDIAGRPPDLALVETRHEGGRE